MQYLYMNHRIRQAKPKKPVIVAQDDLMVSGGEPRTRESNEFDLWHHGEKIGRVVFEPKGLAACDTHEVKAWVELIDTVIVARKEDKVSKPRASAKLPGATVRLA